MAGVTAAGGIRRVAAQSPGRVRGFDHVAVPMQNTEAMTAFYRETGTSTYVRDPDGNLLEFMIYR